MPLMLNEEQTMLRDSAAEFIKGRVPIAQLRMLRDRADPLGYVPEVWAQFAQMGFAGVLIPQAYGGMGLGCMEAGIILEQIGHHLSATPMMSTGVLGARMLALGGTEPARNRWLTAMAQAQAIVALAIDESSKHQPARLETRARPDASGFELSGTKTLVVDGHVADLLLVSARIDADSAGASGVTLFAVDPKAAGVTVERTVMVDAHNAAQVRFDRVRLDQTAVVGSVGAGSALLDAVLDCGRAVLAAQMLGIADEVFARTCDYLKQRKQFGRFIGEFQALQHRAAHLYTEIEITRASVIKALQALDAQDSNAWRHVSVAKARAGMTTTLAVQEAVQMHGGIGMTDQFDLGFFMKRARVCQEWLGDANFHADRLACAAGY